MKDICEICCESPCICDELAMGIAFPKSSSFTYTEKDNKEALEIVEKLMDKDPEPNSLEGKTMNFLVKLIQRFEKRYE